MKRRSISRELITAVLLLELLSALALVGVTVEHESWIRFRLFDAMLRGRADALFGAVGDSDDAQDNVVLDMRSMAAPIPKPDIYDVEEANGRVLGRSEQWPAEEVKSARMRRDGFFRLKLHGRSYRFVRREGVRTVDPGEKNGGVPHPISVVYGSPTDVVWREVWEAVEFYAVASVLLLALTGAVMAWFLRRGLGPLRALAEEAGGISAHRWEFHPPESARATRELAPLTHAIESALDRLHQTFDQQKRFTSDAAHELKTDVAIVKSSMQLLAMRPRTVEEYRQGLAVSLKDCGRLERTVQEMLTFAGVQHGAGAGMRRADLGGCAREAVARLESVAELRGVRPVLTVEGTTVVGVDGKDGDLLCSNLLLNAIQHSGGGDAEVWIGVVGQGGWVTMTVEDSGEGIEPAVLPHVFEPFFRGDASRDRKSGGTGLGLAICKEICEKAGGEIAIFSTVGAGTRVVVRLPAGAASA